MGDLDHLLPELDRFRYLEFDDVPPVDGRLPQRHVSHRSRDLGAERQTRLAIDNYTGQVFRPTGNFVVPGHLPPPSEGDDGTPFLPLSSP